jgi:two-component system sensor histidine kinase AgrC
MDIMDLTRVLGILLDSAFEECDNEPGSYVRIKNNTALLSYTIKNTMSKKHNNNSISDGKSTKPEHSGLGLTIAEQILKGYPLVDLNTYVDKTLFIQSLNIKNEKFS